MQLCAFRAASREGHLLRHLIPVRNSALHRRPNVFDMAHVIAVPDNPVDTGTGAPDGAFLAGVREDAAGLERVGRPRPGVGAAKMTGANGEGTEEEDGFDEAAAAPVEGYDLTRHF